MVSSVLDDHLDAWLRQKSATATELMKEAKKLYNGKRAELVLSMKDKAIAIMNWGESEGTGFSKIKSKVSGYNIQLRGRGGTAKEHNEDSSKQKSGSSPGIGLKEWADRINAMKTVVGTVV